MRFFLDFFSKAYSITEKMPMLNKQDIFEAFQDVELCELLKSKDLCPIMLQNMLEKLYLQSVINNRNKASLIEEAKIHCVKNYTRKSKDELCIELWNHKEYVNSSNMKRIRTCSKKRSKKEIVSQTIVEKPQKVQKSKIDTCNETKIVQLVDSDVKSIDDEYMKYCGMYETCVDENVKEKGSKIDTPVESIKKEKAKKVPKFKKRIDVESIYDECMRWCETNKACAEKNMKEEEPKIVQRVDSDVKSIDEEYMKYCGMYETCDKIDTPVQSIKKEKAKKVQKFKKRIDVESIYDECIRWCETNKACAEKNITEEEHKIVQLVDSEYKCDKIDTPVHCINEEPIKVERSTFNIVQKSIQNDTCDKIDTPVQCINDQQRNTVENKKHGELCTLCNQPCGENKCSKKHMYCKNQMKYTDERIENCVYDSYYDAQIPISESKNKLNYARVEQFRKEIREYQIYHKEGDNKTYKELEIFVKKVSLFYPTMLTEVHKEFMQYVQEIYSSKIKEIGYEFNGINIDWKDLLILNEIKV